MAIGSATSASAVAALRLAVRTLLAPNLYFFLLCALYASLAHLSVVLDLCFRKFSVFPEDDIEAESENAERNEDKCG